MKFGTIGAGAVALAFGREALARGHEVVLSSRRGPDALAHKVAELGRGASAASVEDAASLDYVLLAVPWRKKSVSTNAKFGSNCWMHSVPLPGAGASSTRLTNPELPAAVADPVTWMQTVSGLEIDHEPIVCMVAT